MVRLIVRSSAFPVQYHYYWSETFETIRYQCRLWVYGLWFVDRGFGACGWWFMGCCLRIVDRSLVERWLWFMDCRLWLGYRGFWIVACGLWFVDCGLWIVVFGLWLVVCALWCVDCDFWIVLIVICGLWFVLVRHLLSLCASELLT